jgi:3-hydroxyisobutyrate dehydrogenase-like beta-hydroxyacid dehydrogenase
VTSVGYVGVGKMGLPMLHAAIAAGFEVWVNDVRNDVVRNATSQGARSGSTPREVAEHSNMISIVVKGDEQVDQVVLGKDGILAGAHSSQLLVIHTTVHPRTILKIASHASKLGVEVVDAPMTGGEQGAKEHKLCFMVGGTVAAIERVRPLLQLSASEIYRVGGTGAGAVMKLVQQMIFCLNRLAAYEGMRLAKAYKLDLEIVQQVLHDTAAQSFVVDNWLARYRILGEGDQPPGWTIAEFSRLLLTLSPAIELGRDLGVALPATALIQQLFPVRSSENEVETRS